jgi:Ca2+-binding EF-hand superfamily protein
MPDQRAWVLALAFASAIWGIARAETLHDMDDTADEGAVQIGAQGDTLALHGMDDDLDEGVEDEGMLTEQIEGTEHEALSDEQIEGIEQEGGEHQPLSAEEMHGIHKKMDANGDGKVSMAEILAFSDSTRRQIAEREVETVLEEMDLDKDGKLSVQELVKDLDSWGGEDVREDEHEAGMMKEVETAKFGAADTNMDGLLDIHELPAMFYPETHEGVLDITSRQSLRQKDGDGDGLLSLQEFWRGGLRPDDALDQEGEELLVTDDEKEEFQKLDADHSGKLDVQELKAFESGRFQTEEAMKSLFELADKDKDMHITAEELGAAREQIAGSEAHYPFVEWAGHYNDDL